MVNGLRVAVAGGGIGGLCLAQGLLKAGIDVTVYERDAHLAVRRQGYRLHADGRAGRALEQCLPPESFAVFQATCAEKQMREYGYAAVAASSQAEAETGMRHNRLMFWLYRRMTGTSARVTS